MEFGSVVGPTCFFSFHLFIVPIHCRSILSKFLLCKKTKKISPKKNLDTKELCVKKIGPKKILGQKKLVGPNIRFGPSILDLKK